MDSQNAIPMWTGPHAEVFGNGTSGGKWKCRDTLWKGKFSSKLCVIIELTGVNSVHRTVARLDHKQFHCNSCPL